jgi:hypothetical protein
LLTKFLGGFCGIAAALLLTGKAERRRKLNVPESAINLLSKTKQTLSSV